MYDDTDMIYRVFRSFNQWLDSEWGFNFEGRIYAPPIIPMLDVDRASGDGYHHGSRTRVPVRTLS
jgi:hypothetical protein